MTTIYVAIVEDRHYDVDVAVFLDKDAAIAYAHEPVAVAAERYGDAVKSDSIPAWVANFRTYDDGPRSHVVKQELR